MESAGTEGMVAIITGLRDAGLSVTVRDARLAGVTSGRASVANATSQGHMRTSSGVQTSRQAERSLSNTQFHRNTYEAVHHPPAPHPVPPSPAHSPTRMPNPADIQQFQSQLNGMRASLMANGQAVPSASRPRAPASPVRSPSAPLRRPSPEMAPRPAQAQYMVPVRDVSHRSSINLNRGSAMVSSISYRQDKASNAFVDSLRKYPNSSVTERTLTVEVLERLIAHAQAKNASRKSTRARRVRSLTRQSHESSGLKRSTNKLVPGSRNESQTREVIAAVYGAERKKRLLSLVGRDGNKNRQGSVSYECLTKSFAHAHRNTDVRYLSDVTRYVRDTLRQIGHNEDEICPHMLNRYSAHRREFHQTETDCRGNSSRNLGQNVRMKMVTVKEKLCLVCNQTEPCRCDLPPPCPCPENRPTNLKDRLKSLDWCEEFNRLCNQQPIFEACTCPQDVDLMIDELVDNWLKNIPIYAGYSYKDKVYRDEIVNELKMNLKEHVGKRVKCQKDVVNCLKNLPMWLPPDETDYDRFKETLGEKLLTSIVNIDLFGSRVRKWVENLPFLPDIEINKNELADNLARKLKDIAMTARDLRNDLVDATYEALDDFPIRVCSCMEKEDLAEKLTDSLMSLPKEVIDNLMHLDDFSCVRKKVELLEKVKKWVSGIPIDTSVIIDRDEVSSDLTEQLDAIVDQTEPGELWNAVKKTARRKLEVIKKIQGGNTEMEIQASRLADILTSDLFSAVVDKWSKTIAFDHNANVVRELFAHELTKKLQSALENVEPEEAEEVMKNITSEMLNSMPTAGSLSLKVAQAAKLANALSKLGSQETTGIKEIIKNWVEEVPFESASSEDTRNIVNNLAKKIKNTVDTKPPDTVWHTIKHDALKEIGNIPVTCNAPKLEKHVEQLADRIIGHLFDEVIKNWVSGIPFKQGLETYVSDFGMKINELFKDKNLSDDNTTDALKGQIHDELQDEWLECDDVEKGKLIDGLVDTVKKGPKIRDKITMVIENWLQIKVPLIAPLSSDRVNGMVKKFKTKLNATSPRDRWNTIKETAIEELESLPIDCLPSEMIILAEDLASSLASDEFQETVKEWVKGLEFDPFSEELVEQFTIDLSTKLKDVVKRSNIEDARDNMKLLIINELNEVPVVYDTPKKEEEAHKLLDALDKIKKDEDNVLIQVENWFKSIPFLPEPPVNKIKVTKRLAKDLRHKLEPLKPESTWHELKAVTKDELERLPVSGGRPKIEKFAENLANLLILDILLETIRNWTKKVPFDRQKSINKHDVVYDTLKKVQNILDTIDTQDCQEKLTEGIIKNLDNLPVMCTKSQKKILAEELASAIMNIPRQQDQFGQSLHDWYQIFPFDTKEPVDAHKEASKMEDVLKKVYITEPPDKTRDKMKDELIESVNKYKSTCNDAEKVQLVEVLADKLVSDIFSDVVRRWVNSIPLKPTPPTDNAEVSLKLTEKLRPKFALSKPDKDDIINTIREHLNKLPVDYNPITKETYLMESAKDLYEKLLKCPPEETEERKRKRRPKPTFAINVNEMLKGVTVSLDAKDNETIVKKTLDKLRTLRSEGKDEASIRKEIKRDIEQGVDECLTGKKTDPQARKNLAKKLYSQVFDTFKEIGSEQKKELAPKFKKSVTEWLTASPEISIPKSKTEEIIHDLTERLADEAVGVGTQKDIKHKMIRAISHTLDNISSTFKTDTNLKNTLTERLIEKLTADLGVIPKESKMAKKTENVLYVDISKRENGTQADQIEKKKRIKNSPLIFSDNYDSDHKLMEKDKFTVVDDLLDSFKKSTYIPEYVYEERTELQQPILKKKRRIESIPEIPKLDFNIQVESNKGSLINEDLYRNKGSSRTINKMTDQFSNYSRFLNASEMPNYSRSIENNYIERTTLPLESDETFTENERVAKNLIDNLTSLQALILHDKQIKNELNAEDELTENNLADKLLVKLLKTVEATLPTSNKKIQNHRQVSHDLMSEENLECAIKRDVTEWLKEISEISDKPLTKEKQHNVKRLTVNIAEYIEKPVTHNSNSGKSFNFKRNLVNKDTIESTSSSTSYSMSASDDDAEKYNTTKKCVTDWIKGILKSCDTKPVGTEKIIIALTNLLAKVESSDFNKIETRKKLVQDIVNKLNFHFKLKGEHIDTNTKQILANQLIDEIRKSDTSECQTNPTSVEKKHFYSPKNTKFITRKWMESIPELSNHAEQKQIKRLIRSLAKKIDRVLEQNLPLEETRQRLFNIISDKLAIALKNMTKQMNNKVKQTLINELLCDLTKSNYNLGYDNKNKLIENVEKDVNKWIEEIFGLFTKSSKNKKMAGKIIRNLVEIITSSPMICNKEVRNNIVDQIIVELDNVYDDKSNSSFAVRLLEKITKTAERFQADCCKKSDNNENISNYDEHFDKLKNTNISLTDPLHKTLSDQDKDLLSTLEDAFKKNVSDWLEECPEFQGDTIAHERENERMTIHLSKSLALLKIRQKDNLNVQKQMQKEIQTQIGKTFFYRGKCLDKNTKNRLSNELFQKIMNTVNQIESFSNETNRLENIKNYTFNHSGETKKNTEACNYNLPLRLFKDCISNWFDDVPELQANNINEEKLHNKVFRELARNIANLQVQYLARSDVRNRMADEIERSLDFISTYKDVCLNANTKYNLIYELINKISKAKENLGLATCFMDNITSSYNTSSIKRRHSCLEDSNAGKSNEHKTKYDQFKLNIKECVGKALEKNMEQTKLKEECNLVNKSTNTLRNFVRDVLINKDFHDNVIWEWVQDVPLASYTSEEGGVLGEFDTSINEIKNMYVGDDFQNEKVARINRKLNNALNYRDIKNLQSTMNLKPKNNKKIEKSSCDPNHYRKCTSSKRSVGQFNLSPSKVFHVEEGGVKEISRDIDANTQAKIFELILNNIDSMNEPEDRNILKKQVVLVLVEDARLPQDEAEDLAESILKSAEEQAASSNSDQKQLLSILRQEIRKIMAEFPLNPENTDMIEEFLMDLEVKRLFAGTSYDDDATKESILRLIKEKGGLSDKDAKALLGKLGGNYENIMSSPSIRKSVYRIKSNMPGIKSLGDMLNFEAKAKERLQDFFDTYVDYPPPEKQKRIDDVVKETVSNLEDLLEGIEDRNNATNKIRPELNTQLRRVSLDTAESVTDLLEDVVEDLADAYIQSISKEEKEDKMLSERIEKYTTELEKVIENWLEDLPLTTDDLENEHFKKTMIEDLAGNIVDREKYLQTHPEMRTSEAEERDNLRNTCHIWMKKFLEDDDLKMAMSGTDDLIDAIKGVYVPKLISEQPYLDALQDEIFKWVASLPPNSKPTIDGEKMKKHVGDLANQIKALKGKPDAEEKIRAAINNTLPLIFEDKDKAELKKLGSSLFNTLMNKGFTDDTWTPDFDKTGGKMPTYMDALQKEILDWTKQLPPHIKPTVNNETMKNRVADLAKIIQTHKGKPDAEEKIREAIAQTLPMIYGDLDDDELRRMESSLFNTLMKKGFTDDTWVPELSVGDKPTYLGALQKEILGWVKGLPPDTKPTVDDDKLRKHVQNLAKNIENLKGKPDAEEKIRAAINNTLPLIFEDKDKAELKKLGSSLFNTLMNKGFSDDTWTPDFDKTGGKMPTYMDALQKEILDWTKQLPPHIKPTVNNETMKNRVADLAKIIQTHKGKPDAEEKIREAIAQTLPMIYGDLDDDELHRLESSLFNTLMKKGFTDDTWVPELSVGDKPTYLGALQKEILGWVKGLPPDTKPTVDDDKLRKHVQNLAKNIENLKGKPDAEEKIRAAIGQALPEIFGNLDDTELKRLESSLFNTLMNKGFADDTWDPEIGGKKPTYLDALQKEILDWAKRLPPHIKPTVDNNTMKKQVGDLAKIIQTHKGKPDAEEKIRAAIAQTLPSIYGDLDDKELRRMESSLFNALMKKGFTDDTWVPELSIGDKPTYLGALQKEILGWVKGLPPDTKPTVDNDKLRKHVQDLAKNIENLKGKPDAENKIRAAIGQALPEIFGNLDTAALKGLESSLFNTLMKKGFTDDTWVPEDAMGFNEEKMIDDVLDWLKHSPIYQNASPEEKRKMELAAIEMAKGLNKTLANLKPGSDAEKMLHNEIKKHLKNIIPDPENKYDDTFWNKTADNVLNYLKAKPAFQELTGLVGPDNLLALAVDDWVSALPIDVKTKQDQEHLNEAKNNLILRLEQARALFPTSAPEHEQAIRDEAKKFLRANLTDPHKRSDEKYIDDMATRLVKLLNTVPITPLDSLDTTIKPYRSPADTLFEYIGEWVNSLPIQGEEDKVNLMKQNLTSKLINKIGELNLNPDIFNDAELYQYSLSDEIDKLLENIPRNPELDKYLPALKKDLIFKIMDARQKILDELAGKVYKQNLRDKISTSLPLPGCLTVDEEASFELIKDKLADAFIDLHFSYCEGIEFDNYKEKMSKELNRFCTDILRHYPCARIDVEKVKDDLHKALMRVPVPRDDSMKSEVEQVRIRDIVNEWMREIPLRQETASDKLRRHKLAVVLAKHIHDIEMEKQHNDFIDSEQRIRDETRKFMNMIPVREDRAHLIPDLIQKLINRLECSKDSRRFFSADRCQTCVTQELESFCTQDPLTSTLCPAADQTINDRDSRLCKDALSCTPLIDSCSQTCQGVPRMRSQKSCTAIPQKMDASCMTQKESPCHITPRILVKEYIWDSPEICTGAHEYTPPCIQRSCSQGVQARPPQPCVQQTSPKCIYPPCPSQHPSMHSSPKLSVCPPIDAQRSCYSPYNTRSVSPRQGSQHPMQSGNPPPLDTLPGYPYSSSRHSTQQTLVNDQPPNPDRYSPQEREIPFTKPPSYSTDDPSEEEWMCPGPSRYFRRPYMDSGEERMGSCRRRGFRRSDRCDNDDFWTSCWRHRGRPMAGYRSDKIKEKCDCKDRLWMTCKGRRDRFIDMCQACGTTCPHPQPYLYNPECRRR